MFESVPVHPPDPILGLTEAIRLDPRPDKINLGMGVYRDEQGKTPLLRAVKAAERCLLEREQSKIYLPIAGDAAYDRHIQSLLFGDDHPIVREGRAATVQSLGGTGALWLTGAFLRWFSPGATVWLSEPTWPNHPKIFRGLGLAIATYPYLDASGRQLGLDALLATLEQARPGDAVVLHGCCHNPSGVDPAPDEWQQIAALLARRGAVPVVDFAYQGFGDGLHEDTLGIRTLARETGELVVCNSFSKTFSLYNERVGAMTLVTASAAQAASVLSQVESLVRANYSNPPAHGAMVVNTILEDPELRRAWEEELAEIRQRIRRLRLRFATGLDARGVRLHPDGNDFIVRQKGMFSFSHLDETQVERLKQEHAVYIVRSGRINVAGMNEAIMDRLCDAIQAITAA